MKEMDNGIVLPADVIAGREVPGWCGPACLAHVALHFGIEDWGEKKIGEAIGASVEKGTGHEQMLKGVKLMGLEGEWVKKTLEELDTIRQKEGAQVILNWMTGEKEEDDGHYSIFDGFCTIGPDETPGITLNDPEWVGSFRIMERQKFEDVWYDIDQKGEVKEGYALIIRNPSPQQPQTA